MIHRSVLTLIAAIFLALPSAAFVPDGLTALGNKEKKELINKISSDYSNWSRVELNGKMHVDALPLSPSVKIFMERGKQLFITVRAPFLGEVARVEADKDSILLVNKMKRTYCKEDLQGVARIATITLSDIQDLLLARMFVAGKGTLKDKYASRLDIYSVDDGGWLVVPKRGSEDNLVDYGYVVSPHYELSQLIVKSVVSDKFGEIEYGGRKKDRSIEFILRDNDREYGFTLTYGSPKWGAKPFERIELGSKYRRLGIGEFIKTAF